MDEIEPGQSEELPDQWIRVCAECWMQTRGRLCGSEACIVIHTWLSRRHSDAA